MADEFQESEVFFDTDIAAGIGIGIEDNNNNNIQHLKLSDPTSMARRKTKRMSKSLPVNIPENFSKNSRSFQCYEEDGKIVPPHVIVGRRRRAAGGMACSVCSGNGRTLKGRDLSEVRNSVLKMTGFLET